MRLAQIGLTLLALCLAFPATTEGKPLSDKKSDGPKKFAPKFYAFLNGVSFGPPEKEAETLKKLGFAGVSQVNGRNLKERVAAYEKAGLRVLSIYLNVNDRPIRKEQVEPLKNRGAMIELTVNRWGPKTVEAVRKTAEMAAKLKIRVALYPHHRNSVETMPQAMKLIAEVKHDNLGVMFNLCHFLKNEKLETLEGALEKAGSRLFAVTTCGAQIGGSNWGQLIQTLDRGNFPQERLFGALKKLKFQGPVGLQCYAIKGDKLENLKRSMAKWKQVMKGVETGTN
ncbi:MAG: TIM barrel protein [Planctomycetota bacterium]